MKSLSVYMNGFLVGALLQEASGANTFQYDPAWLKTDGARPISLSMPLRASKYEGEVVFNFFDNLLPDNREIRERIAGRFQAASLQPFDLLYEIGRDCVGALILQPPGEPMSDLRAIRGETLDKASLDAVLRGYLSASPYLRHESADFRISHFLATARKCGFSEARMGELLKEFYDKTPQVLSAARQQLPENFPPHISDAIFTGLVQAARRLGT